MFLESSGYIFTIPKVVMDYGENIFHIVFSVRCRGIVVQIVKTLNIVPKPPPPPDPRPGLNTVFPATKTDTFLMCKQMKMFHDDNK